MTSGGPRITRDNLVLCLDAHDAKSYPGQPVTNLCYSGSGLYQYLAQSYDWDNSGAATRDRDVRNIRKPKAANNPLFNERYIRICSCVCTTAGSQHFGMGYTTSVSASTQYMVSMYYRQNKSGIGAPYIRGVTSNANHGSLKWIGRDGKQDISGSGNWPVNEWIRLKCYATTNSNETGLYISNYIGGTIGDKIWSFGPQIETGSKFSPLVRQTRSTTGAWKGRVGSNDLTFNGGVDTGASHYRKGQVIEPKSNAYISFDGTDDYLERAQGFQIGNTRQKTVEAWVKDWASGTIVSMTDHGNNYKWQQHARGTSQIMTGSGYGTRYGFPEGYTASGWHHWVDVCDEDLTATNRVKRYIDGVLRSSNSQSTDDGSSFYDGTDLYLHVGAMNYGSGAANFFNGEISVVRIYNIALSQSQAKANFNAQRGRYGV